MMSKNEKFEKRERRSILSARYYIAISKVIPGIADDMLIAELRDIAQSYEQLIREGLPKSADINAERYKIADCHDRIASILSWRGELHQAKASFEAAMHLFAEIGNTTMVESCQQSLHSLALRGEGDVDAELQRLYTALEHAAPSSLEYVEILADLGTLLVTAGDNFAAKEYLHTAERAMIDMGHPFPSAQALQAALQDYLAHAGPRTKKISYWAPFFLSALGRPKAHLL